MKLLILSIKDIKAKQFLAGQMVANLAVFLRDLGDQVNQVDPTRPNPLNAHSADFQLWKIGELDQDTGIITPEENGPTHVINVSDLKQV